jgi:hypothetical protein
MSDKKSVLLGILITSIIVLSVVSVSAGWFSDLFGGDDLEGELPTEKPAEVFANVSPAGNPPIVFKVYQPYSPVTTPGYADLNFANVNNGQTEVNFSFLVTESTGTSSNLIRGDVTNYVRGNFTLHGSTQYRDIDTSAGSCFNVNEGVESGFNYVNYSCSVTAEFYDFPIYNWTIKIEFLAPYGSALWSVVNDTTNFSYTRTLMINITPDYINFSALTPNVGDTLAERNVEIYNYGNANITLGGPHQLRMNATTLWNVTELAGGITRSITAHNFTGNALGSGTAEACSTTLFDDYNFVGLDVAIRSDSSVSMNSSYFCAVTVPDVPAGAYKATPFNWTIENYGT